MIGLRSLGAAALIAATALFALPVAAQSTSATLTGTVSDQGGAAIAGADVVLTGAVTRSISTTANGAFTFTAPPGLYRLDVNKAGFTGSRQDDVTLVSGETLTVHIVLAQASFSSLKTIGRVSVAANAPNRFNTSTASIADVPAAAFVQQGQLSVTRVLNQLPGITVSPTTGFGTNTTFLANGASPLATGVTQIRGALPYETASLIDGHPISLGVSGIFNPVFLNPYVLQNVEVVKGPGATAPNINYAIGGTVNYRTLQPTATRVQSLDMGIDQFGGTQANVRATGTLPGSHWAYAFDYATQGTQGYNRGFSPVFGAPFFLGPTTINGTSICQNPAEAFCGLSFTPGNPNFVASQNIASQYVLCCPNLPMNYNSRNELGKIRYNFSSSSGLTLTYLGAQARGDEIGGLFFELPGTTFAPPAGYTGSLAPNTETPFDLASSIGSLAETNANLFQAEFNTALGKTTTLLLRGYWAGVQEFEGGPGDQGPTPGTLTLSGTLYGGVPLNNDTTPTIFNGTPAVIVSQDAYGAQRSYDRLNGFTAEVDQQLGDDLVSLSYDHLRTNSKVDDENSIPFLASVPVPDGTAQTFDTLMLRGQFEIGSHINMTVSNNTSLYTDRYSQDGGLTFLTSTHSYNAPRLSFTWQPHADLSVRGAVGYALAPPYVNLLTNSGAVLPSNIQPAQYYTTTANSGDVKPETAFAFDLGFDKRLPSFTILSMDVYQTTLQNQFLPSTFINGTYTPPANSGLAPITAPLYVTKTENLGHSRYEGVEASLRRVPNIGWGYTLSGSLMRAYPYDLPAGFYDTAAGPNTTNLAVLPNINFQSSGLSYNALSSSRVPYSMGYAETNRRGGNGSYFLLGATYYGPNNAFNEPPFFVLNTSFEQPITKYASANLSVANLTGVYSNFYYNFLGTTVPTPLANGLLGFAPANVLGPTNVSLTLHFDL